MSKSLCEAPWATLDTKELISNQGPALLARQAQECGPDWRPNLLGERSTVQATRKLSPDHLAVTRLANPHYRLWRRCTNWLTTSTALTAARKSPVSIAPPKAMPGANHGFGRPSRKK